MTEKEAKELLDNLIGMVSDNQESDYDTALKMAIKALDHEPKTGHWTKSSIGGAKICSICQAHMGLSSFKYCPNCGARMKGGAK